MRLSRQITAIVLGAVAGIALLGNTAQAGGPRTLADRWARNYASSRPWHGQYYHTEYSKPVALIVPPTAKMMTSYSWGVSQSEVSPIYHQFGRSYPGNEAGIGAQFHPTPIWPSHTDQFGVYPVRGPW